MTRKFPGVILLLTMTLSVTVGDQITSRPFFNSPPPGMGPLPMPYPMPPIFSQLGFPGHPMPMPMPMAAPIPLLPAPPPKLPVIVMPFYSPVVKPKPKQKYEPKDAPCSSEESYGKNKKKTENKKYKKNSREEYCSSEEHRSNKRQNRKRSRGRSDYRRRHDSKFHYMDLSSEENSDEVYDARRHIKKPVEHKKPENPLGLITPMIQYVNDNGYVIYEKTISDDEAKEWLDKNKNKHKSKTKQPMFNNIDHPDDINKEKPTKSENDIKENIRNQDVFQRKKIHIRRSDADKFRKRREEREKKRKVAEKIEEINREKEEIKKIHEEIKRKNEEVKARNEEVRRSKEDTEATRLLRDYTERKKNLIHKIKSKLAEQKEDLKRFEKVPQHI